MITKRIRYIVGSRPDFIPDGWIILNAPRPLYGHKTWEGDFVSGCHYAAIDMNDSWGKDYLRESLRLDADPIQYIDAGFMEQWLREYCKREGYTFEECFFDANDIRVSFHQFNESTTQFNV